MKLKKFSGLDTVNDTIDVGLTGLRVAKNVDIDRNGRPSTRRGRGMIWSGVPVAIWQNLFLTGAGELMMIDQDDSVRQIGSGIDGYWLTGAEINGLIYFSTGLYNGVIEDGAVRAMGVIPPADFTMTIINHGNLKSGRYLAGVSYVAEDGRESALSDIKVVELLDNEAFSVFVSPPSGYSANIYASTRNGEELYFLGNLSSIVVNEPRQLMFTGDPVMRQYFGPFPSVNLFEEHRGVLLAAVDNFLLISESHDYEICNLRAGQEFGSSITMLKSIESGVFIGTKDEIFFASGDPHSFDIRSMYPVGAKKNTQARIDLTNFGKGDSSGYGAIFTTTKGDICIGVPGGNVINLTKRKAHVNAAYPLTAAMNGNRYVVAVT